MESPIRILLNPASGAGRARRRWARVAPALLASFGDRLIAVSSEAPGDLMAQAHGLANQPGLVVAAGGDGTSHEVLNGLLEGVVAPSAPMWWIPLGSGNDLARTLGAATDAPTIVSQLQTPKYRHLDVGQVHYRADDGTTRSRWFGNSLTMGVPGAALALVKRSGKGLGGPWAYGMAAIVALLKSQPLAVRMDIDGVRTDGRFLLVAFTNGGRFGAGMQLAPGARLDDGRLDLVTVDGMPPTRALRVFPRVYRGTHLSHPAVTRHMVEHATLQIEGEVGLEIDGELVAARPPLSVRVWPGRLRVLHPEPGL